MAIEDLKRLESRYNNIQRHQTHFESTLSALQPKPEEITSFKDYAARLDVLLGNSADKFIIEPNNPRGIEIVRGAQRLVQTIKTVMLPETQRALVRDNAQIDLIYTAQNQLENITSREQNALADLVGLPEEMLAEVKAQFAQERAAAEAILSSQQPLETKLSQAASVQEAPVTTQSTVQEDTTTEETQTAITNEPSKTIESLIISPVVYSFDAETNTVSILNGQSKQLTPRETVIFKLLYENMGHGVDTEVINNALREANIQSPVAGTAIRIEEMLGVKDNLFTRLRIPKEGTQWALGIHPPTTFEQGVNQASDEVLAESQGSNTPEDKPTQPSKVIVTNLTPDVPNKLHHRFSIIFAHGKTVEIIGPAKKEIVEQIAKLIESGEIIDKTALVMSLYNVTLEEVQQNKTHRHRLENHWRTIADQIKEQAGINLVQQENKSVYQPVFLEEMQQPEEASTPVVETPEAVEPENPLFTIDTNPIQQRIISLNSQIERGKNVATVQTFVNQARDIVQHLTSLIEPLSQIKVDERAKPIIDIVAVNNILPEELAQALYGEQIANQELTHEQAIAQLPEEATYANKQLQTQSLAIEFVPEQIDEITHHPTIRAHYRISFLTSTEIS